MVLVFLIAFAFIAGTFGLYLAQHGSTQEEASVSRAPVLVHNPFDNISLRAKSAYVYDLRTKTVLFSHNEEAQLPLASLTKIMTVILAAETFSKDALITVSADSLMREGDSGLYDGAVVPWRSLTALALVASSNDAAAALAASGEGARANPRPLHDVMNAKANELGLTQTLFLNETGLDTSHSLSGAYGSAKDVATLLTYAVENHGDVFESSTLVEVTPPPFLGKTKVLKNTNDALSLIPNIIASKTGFTDLSGGNLAIIFDAGLAHPVAVVVLGSSEDDRFSDVLSLVSTTLQLLSAHL